MRQRAIGGCVRRLLQLVHRFENSRLGSISAWVSFIAMAWIAIVAPVYLVLRRISGAEIDLTDAVLLLLAIIAARACRAIYVVLILPARSRAAARKRGAA